MSAGTMGVMSPALPVAGSVTDVISGWGQYKDRVSLLPAQERAKIDRLADRIVSSFAQFAIAPFREVLIVGHADKDRHGEGWESTVSFNRAKDVEETLTATVLSLWVERKMGPAPAGDIQWTVKDMGSKKMIAPAFDPRNRRVEVTLFPKGAPIPAPPVPDPDDTLEGRIGRLLKLLATQRVAPDPTGGRSNRARCVLTKLLNPAAIDVFVDGRVSDQTINGKTPKSFDCVPMHRNAGWNGNYDDSDHPIPDPEFRKFLSTVRPILKGGGFAPDKSDTQVLTLLGEIIKAIDDGINQVDGYLTRSRLIGGKNDFKGDPARLKLQRLYRAHLHDQNNIYSCYYESMEPKK